MFDMTNDSGLFIDEPNERNSPLYEAKMIYHYDHRFATYAGATEANLNAAILPQASSEEKQDPYFSVQPRYWIEKDEVQIRLGKWKNRWLLAFRGIGASINERTTIFTLLPIAGAGNSCPILFTEVKNPSLVACLLANFNSLVLDNLTRQKVGGSNLNFFILKQLPIFPPAFYSDSDIEFIVPRVLELTYTSWDIRPFADDIWEDASSKLRRSISARWESKLDQQNEGKIRTGQIGNKPADGIPFAPVIWDDSRRSITQAELDAYFANLYRLDRDDLHYVLDPKEAIRTSFPSETFRVLKERETSQFGEYRTRRLVLEAWDRLFG